MSRWLEALDQNGRHTDGDGRLFRFAANQSDQPVFLELVLSVDGQLAAPPLTIHSETAGCRLVGAEVTNAGIHYHLAVDPSAEHGNDDEAVISVAGPGVPPCRVELRRSHCALSTGLLGEELEPATRAALLWHSYRRFRELVGLKRFGTGRSGSKVLVFRPRLRAPQAGIDPALAGCGPCQVLDGAWGAWLLVKTGDWPNVEQEWVRFQTFLVDRLHPFLARNDACLSVALAAAKPMSAPRAPQATLISSFLGGDLLRTETLEEVIRGSEAPQRCQILLDRIAAVLHPWHAPTRDAEQPLSAWERVFGQPGNGKLFNRFDLAQEDDRKRYVAGVSWDIAFIQQEHLHHHLLGRKQPGLLSRLGEIRTRFGLIHGDLTTRNVLCQGDHVWLIDFEHAGAGPVLADFARLEATIRLWCLTLGFGSENVAVAAERFERHLLDHFHGSAGSLEPVTALAPDMGADPGDLLRVAYAIADIRRHAASFCNEAYGDRRDYLAVLYLTVLSLLRYAGDGTDSPASFRILVSLAWVLEEALCRLTCLAPFNRHQSRLQPPQLLARDWLAEAGAPARLRYLMERDDGRRALAPLAATRGVWQNPHHHLDVYDHTILVLAYLEAVLRDPIAALLDPAALDRGVVDDLQGQGIVLLPIPQQSANPAAPIRPEVCALAEPVAEFLAETVGSEERLLLKWLAVLHDVGKPGTRCLHEGKVTFLGHELYGLQLLRGHLAHLCPEDDLRLRMEQLIRYHHIPHQVAGRFIDHPADFDALVRGLASGSLPAKLRGGLEKYLLPDHDEFIPDFVGLLLHGYADRLAGRGQPLGPTAEIYLAVLGFCARAEAERPAQQTRTALYRRLSQRYRDLNPDASDWEKSWGLVMGELRTWHRLQCGERSRRGEPEPSWEESCAQADDILQRRYPRLNSNVKRLD